MMTNPSRHKFPLVLITSALSAVFLLSACGGAAQKGLGAAALQNGGVPTNGTQLAATAVQVALSNQSGTATPATTLPAKLSCKEISTRLIKSRNEMASSSNAGSGDNTIAMAAGAASLLGTMTGKGQLTSIGNQLGSAVPANQSNQQTPQMAELESRANAQKCKLPVEALVSPAVSRMSCSQLTSEWTAATQTNTPQQPSAGAANLAGGNMGKLAQVGAVASLAGTLTGNKSLTQVGDLANGQNQGGAPSKMATSEFSRQELETAANARHCKLSNSVAGGQVKAGSMSCDALKQELKSLGGAGNVATSGNQIAEGAQTLGMLASVAGALSGNQNLKMIGDQANAVGGSGNSAADNAARRAAIETLAKAQRCKVK